MITKKNKFILSVSTITLLFSGAYAEIKVVAAENFYANVVTLIGGKHVKTNSIINNPDADPHLFTTSASTAIAIEDAQVIIYNGADYDPWMTQLLGTKSNNDKVAIIDIGVLMNIKSGDNPHLWYKPDTFPTLAKKLTVIFSQIEPEHTKTFELNYKKFNDDYQTIYSQIDDIKARFNGIPVTATEPVFNYMADALGLKMLGQKFQWTVMNDAEAPPRMLAKYQNLFKQNQVNVLFHNQQVHNNMTQNILSLAKTNNIPNVGVTESMPQNDNVITWLKSNLDNTEKALEQASKKESNTTKEKTFFVNETDLINKDNSTKIPKQDKPLTKLH